MWGLTAAATCGAIPAAPGKFANGVFVINKGTRMKEITDGTSHTAIVGERAWESKVRSGIVPGRAAVVFGIRGVRHNSEEGLADGMGCGKYQLNFSSTTGSKPESKAHARLFQPSRGQRHFALADGSVQFVSDTIEGDFDANQWTITDTVDSPWEALLGINDSYSQNAAL